MVDHILLRSTCYCYDYVEFGLLWVWCCWSCAVRLLNFEGFWVCFVETHLPCARSLRIVDSSRAIIAFREACDPHVWINIWLLMYGVVNDAWLCLHLDVLRSIVIESISLGLFKTFAPKHNLVFSKIESTIRHRRGGQVWCVCVCFCICTKQPCEGGEHFQAKPCQSVSPRDTHDHTCLRGTRG